MLGVVDRVYFDHVIRAGTVGDERWDNRTTDLLHLVALRRFLQRGHRDPCPGILSKVSRKPRTVFRLVQIYLGRFRLAVDAFQSVRRVCEGRIPEGDDQIICRYVSLVNISKWL